MIKRLLVGVICMLSAILAMADNIVSVSTACGKPGERVTVTVSLTNSEEIVAAELSIPLDAQLSYVENSCVLNKERANGHSVTAGVKDGSLHIIIYSMMLRPLKGQEGALLTFDLDLKRIPKEIPLVPGVVLSDAAGKAVASTVEAGAVTILSPMLEVTTPQIDYGHIPIRNTYARNITLRNSGTETLEVSDVTFTAAELSTSETAFTIEAGATRNIAVVYAPEKRGAMSATATIVSNAANTIRPIRIVADPYSVNELHVGSASGIADEEVEISLTMNNMEPIVAAQFAFKLPEALVYVDGSFQTSTRSKGHSVTAVMRNDTLSFMIYSLRNAVMTGNDGEIATFKLRLNGRDGTYYLNPTKVVLSNAAMENMTSATNSGQVRIKSPRITGDNSYDMGSTPVTEKAVGKYSLRNAGQAPLTIERVTFLSRGWEVITPLPMEVGVGMSSSIEMTYRPSAVGDYEAEMHIYTNDPENRMKTVAVKGSTYEPNNLVMKGRGTDNSYSIDVSLDNYTPIVGLQMDVHWIKGMVTSNNNLVLADRLKGMSGSVTDMGNNTYRILIFSYTNKTISGNSGEIFTLTFENAGNIDYAGSAITVDNIIMSSTESVNMTSQDMVLHPSKIEYPTDTKFEVDGMYYVVSRQGAEVSVTYDGYNYSSPADEYSGDVVVPSNVMYKGVNYAVTSIAPNAFRDCAGVTSVTLPETVKSIGEQAFMGCTALAQIEFAEGLENIGMGAFVNCNNLTALRLPSTLKSIGDNAFRDCNKVVSVQCDAVVPPKVGSNAFTCYKNAVLYVPVTSTPAYKTTTGWSNFRCAPHEVDGYYYDIISETDVAVTYNEAGYNSYSGYVVIPDRVVIEGVEYRVTAVGDNAFRGSTELESVTLFNGITSIGANAFAGCSKLSELRVECVAPPVLQSTSFDRTHYNISLYVLMGRKNAYRQSQYWNNFTNYIEIDASAVIHPVGTQIEIDGIYYVVTTKGAKVGVSYGGSSYGSMSNEYMGEVVIPDMVSSQGVNYRVTSIEAYAFRDCKSLNAVTIPEGVTSIGQYAFYGCDGLESIAIPSGVTKIESYTYAYCRGLMAVDIPESVATIGERAFVGCTGLSEITLPANITEIGRYAFNDCTQLKQVHSLATTPPTIYSGTFNYYTNLYVPAIATPLYKEVDYWRNFTLVPHQIDGVYYEVVSDANAVVTYRDTQYNSYAGNVVIPATVEIEERVYNVTSVYNYAFYGSSALTSVTIGENIETIGYYAFKNCSSLTSVEIPDNVKILEYQSFMQCESLKTVTLGSGVEHISGEAFYNCSTLTDLYCRATTPPEVSSSIVNNYSSVNLYVPAASMPQYREADYWRNFKFAMKESAGIYYEVLNESEVKVTYRDTQYNSYKGDVEIPTTVEIEGNTYTVVEIGDYAFYQCDSLRSVVIPEGIVKIGSYAFSECSSLSEVTVPQTVTSMGSYAFYNNDALTEVTIHSSAFGNYAFRNCDKLAKVTFGSEVSVIGTDYTYSYIFYDCPLQDVYCEATVPPTIQGYVFSNYSSINLYVPAASMPQYREADYWRNFRFIAKEVDGIYYEVTSDSEVKVTYAGGGYSVVADEYKGAVEIPGEVEIEDVTYLVTAVNSSAFRDCKELTAVTLPGSITTVGSEAFYNCSTLTDLYCRATTPPAVSSSIVNNSSSVNLYVPAASMPQYREANYWRNFKFAMKESAGIYYEVLNESEVKVTYRDTQYNSYKGDVEIPTTVEIEGNTYTVVEIGDYAFYQCDSLRSVVIPEGIVKIGSYAFSGCSALSEVTVPQTVTSMGSYAFYNNDALAEVTIHSSAFGNYAFRNCDKLAKVTFGSEVSVIGADYTYSYIFYDCPLQDVYCEATVPPTIQGYVFSNYSSVNLYVPAASMPQYREADYWRDFKFAMKESAGIYYEVLNESEVKVTYRDTQYNSYKGEVEIPTTVEIESNTYTVVEIGDYAFYQCDSLRSVVIPEGIVKIGSYAFSECSALSEVTVPQTVTSMGSYAFYNNDALTEVTIHSSAFGNDAFRNCDKLAKVTFGSEVSVIGTDYTYSYIFYDCPLQDVYCEATVPPTINGNVFSNYSSINLYVPAASMPQYREADYWRNFKFAMKESAGIYYEVLNESEVKVTYRNTQYNCYKGDVEIPTTVEIEGNTYIVVEIGDYAFYQCDSLRSVVIPEGIVKIGSYAFSECSALSEVTVPQTVTSMGSYAFYNNDALTEVTIGCGNLGYYAFNSCTNLRTITITENVSALGNSDSYGYIFYGCSSLQDIYCYAAVPPVIGYGVFDNYSSVNLYVPAASMPQYREADYWRNFKFAMKESAGIYYEVLNESEVKVTYRDTQYNSYKGEVEIPTTVEIEGNTYTVVEIGDYAFYQCDSLRSVVLPESLQRIGSSAFYSCDNLTSITLPVAVKEIKNYAFYECYLLKEIYSYAEEAPIINSETFYDRGSINLYLPANIMWRYINAMYWKDFKIIKKDIDGIYYNVISEDEVAVTFKDINYNSYRGEVEVPAQVEIEGRTYRVTAVADRAFYECDSLISVVLPNAIDSIGQYAFYSSESLKRVNIPENVTKIERETFYYCRSLQEIVIPNGVTKIEQRAFYYCRSLSEIVIPEGVTEIGSWAFGNCYGLRNVTIPSTVKIIDNYAFYGCSNVNIYCHTEEPPVIYSETFYDYSSNLLYVPVASILQYKSAEYWNRFSYAPQVVDGIYYDVMNETEVAVTFKDRHYNSYRGEVEVPAQVEIEGRSYRVTAVSDYAFYNCDSLISVVLPNAIDSIGQYAFYSSESLNCVNIPENVTKIERETFYYCRSLSEIVIPEGVTEIAYGAFGDCSSLVSVNIPEKITKIESGTFQGCSSLPEIVIPEGVTEIGSWAFGNCYGLRNVTIPSTVKTIDNYGFWECREASIHCHAEEPPVIYSETFYNYSSNLLYVPVASILQYKSAEYWNRFSYAPQVVDGIYYDVMNETEVAVTFKDINYNSYRGEVEVPAQVEIAGCTYRVTAVSDYAFYNCDSLISVVLPNAIDSIGQYAFYSSESLKRVNIPENVTKIERETFHYCHSLQEIVIPNGVTEIGQYAFGDCSSLVSVNIPEKITKIERETFQGCSSLPEIVIPEGVTEIGSWAFAYCYGLRNVTIPSTVKTIDNYGFWECGEATIHCHAEEPPVIYSETFNNYSSNLLYVPVASILRYKSAEYWNRFSYAPQVVDGIYYDVMNETEVAVTFKDRHYNSYRGEVEVPVQVEIEGRTYRVTAVADRAFYECDSLISVVLPNAIDSIGQYAFYSSESLKRVNIPESVTKIERETFYYCRSLQEIVIPNGVTEIGQYAFGDCSSLVSVNIPEKITKIESGTFQGCSSLSEIVIPEGVTEIGSWAFGNCGVLASVELPATIAEIENYAFEGCWNINMVCTKATTPPTIYDNTFTDSMWAVMVPAGCGNAYRSASVWERYKIIEDSDTYRVEVYVTSPGTLANDIVEQCGVQPDEVTHIIVHGALNQADFEVMRTEMTSCYSIDLSDVQCSRIPESAFSEKSYLKNIVLPMQCDTIASYAFNQCRSLQKIDFPERLTTIEYQAFYSCSSLNEITLPKHLKRLDGYVFAECYALTQVHFPDSLEVIEYGCFQSCRNIKHLSLPAGLKRLGSNSFGYCYHLEQVDFPDMLEEIDWGAFYGCSILKDVQLPMGLKRLGGMAFAETKIENIYIPASVEYIDENPYGRCDIRSIVVDENNTKFEVLEGSCSLVETETKRLIIGCNNTIIPRDIVEIGGYAFVGCDFATIDIPASVKVLGNAVFEQCNNLVSVVLPEGLTSIGSSAFSNCYALAGIDIPNSVNYIGSSAFQSCQSLTEIDIPDGVESLYWGTFNSCSKLKRVKLPAQLRYIEGYTFAYCYELEEINIPSQVESIEYSAFNWCQNLKKIDLSHCASLNYISSAVFYGCSKLESVNLPASLDRIGSDAFAECYALVNLSTQALSAPQTEGYVFMGVDNGVTYFALPTQSYDEYNAAGEWSQFIQTRPCIDVTVNDGYSENGGGKVRYDNNWHRDHNDLNADVSGIDGYVGDAMSLYVPTDSLVTFLIDCYDDFDIRSVKYADEDVTDKVVNGVFTTPAVVDNAALEVLFRYKNSIKGDVNRDLNVNITDLVILANHIIDTYKGRLDRYNANVVEDDVINICDVVAIVNIILSGDEGYMARSQSSVEKGRLAVSDVLLAKGETRTIEIELNNKLAYTAFQMDLVLPTGLAVTNVSLSDRATDSHSLLWNLCEDGVVNILGMSSDNAAFDGERGVLLSLEVTADATFTGGDIILTNGIFAARDLTTHYLDAAYAKAGNPTDISDAYSKNRIYNIERTVIIESVCNQVATIATTDGQLHTYSIGAGRNEIEVEQQGVYIVAVGSLTKKILIK